MMRYPLVSILIPSFNHSRFILEAVDSVIADTYPNKELIIIDDGSKDDTKNVLEKWKSDNPDINSKIIYRENKGVCKTLNELVSLSKGKYLVLLASDDYLVNNTIKERVEILEKNPAKMVLISDATAVSDKGEIIFESVLRDFHKSKVENYKDDDSLLKEIIFKFAISGAVVMMDRDIFKITGPYPEDLKVEDFYFYGMAAISKKALFYDRIVSHYRWHGANSSDNNPALFSSTLKTYFRFFAKINGLNLKFKLIKRIIGIYLKK